MVNWLRKYREYRIKCGCIGGQHHPATLNPVSPIRGTGLEAQQAALDRSISRIEDDNVAKKTLDNYGPKIFEFFEYSDYCRSDLTEAQRYLVSAENIQDYVFYVIFRDKRLGNDGKKRKEHAGDYLYFDSNEYETIMASVKEAESRNELPPEPADGVGGDFFDGMRSGLKSLYQHQHDAGMNTIPWENVWLAKLDKLKMMVRKRKARLDKAAYREKIDNTSSPYLVVGQLQNLENWFWVTGCHTGSRSNIFAALRNRYVYLRTLAALLRGESLYKEELSDHFGVEIKASKNPHLMELAISQVATGKTNGNLKLFGRVCRHKDVNMCSYGALGFWLLYRFHCTGEMDTPPDFTSNEDWFDIKVLVGLPNFSSSRTKGISDTTYTRQIKKALKAFNLPHKHQLHFGRREGAVDLECKQLDHEDIRRLGNWDPTIQEKAYSAKIPVTAILSAGNFTEGGGIYFNPRTVVIPPQELQDKLFEFVDSELEAVEAANRDGSELWTALGFLRFMKRMKQVVLQDAAYIMEFHPDRINHPVFQLLVFQSEEFQAFRRLMRASVETAVSPVDLHIDVALPGVIEHIRATQQKVDELAHSSADFRQRVDGRFDLLERLILGGTNIGLERTAAAFTAAAAALRYEGSEDGQVTDDSDTSSPASAPPPLPVHGPFAGYGYKFDWNDIASVQSVCDQWFGDGKYVNTPVAGGLQAMESQHGNQWRQEWCRQLPSRSKSFSRVKKVGTEATRLMKKYQFTKERAIELLAGAMTKHRSISTLADKIGKVGSSDDVMYGITTEAAGAGIANEGIVNSAHDSSGSTDEVMYGITTEAAGAGIANEGVVNSAHDSSLSELIAADRPQLPQIPPGPITPAMVVGVRNHRWPVPHEYLNGILHEPPQQSFFPVMEEGHRGPSISERGDPFDPDP
jgi:hypothetical protein